MDTRYLAAEHARGLAEILLAMGESPTQPTKDYFSAVAAIADLIAREADGEQARQVLVTAPAN